jgi:hypothetical protein
MRLHRFLTVAALTVGAPVVAATSALAYGTWNTPGYSVQVQLPPFVSPWSQVAQVPIFGGPRYIAEQPPVYVPQTAELPADPADHTRTFVAPGVDQNATGQIEPAQ